jgi:hypothetical protein
MKIFALINGAFYLLYGLYGLFMPQHLASKAMGWVPDLLGLHQIRAIWAATAGAGIIIILVALRVDLPSLTKAIILITACFFIGRVVGLMADGMGPRQTYYEMGLEVGIVGLGLWLLSRAT